MTSLEISILESMDSEDRAILPHLWYILQDIWTLGTEPKAIINLLKDQYVEKENLSVLDLGCGKGAVSIQLAAALGCRCYGIDGIASFIEDAHQYARKFNVEDLCTFEVGDIRKKIKEFSAYDVIVLGAIGPVFGNYAETLQTMKSHLLPGGSIIIDDAYHIDDLHSETAYQSRSQISRQIHAEGMEIIDEHIFSKKVMQHANEEMFQNIKSRCEELILQFPDKKQLFEDYLKSQLDENQILESDVINAIFLLQKK